MVAFSPSPAYETNKRKECIFFFSFFFFLLKITKNSRELCVRYLYYYAHPLHTHPVIINRAFFCLSAHHDYSTSVIIETLTGPKYFGKNSFQQLLFSLRCTVCCFSRQIIALEEIQRISRFIE